MSDSPLPMVIQGGMGVGISNWELARAVSMRGHLGVVSGTAIDSLFIRRLQDGDPGGHVRRAMAHFPIPGVADAILKKYFTESRNPTEPYKMVPMYRVGVSVARENLTMMSSFVEVWLAKEGHSGQVGINVLTKVQFPNLAVLYGAMLAGVHYVLMGAGIPKDIPAVLDAFAEGLPGSIRLDVEGGDPDKPVMLRLDPAAHWSTAVGPQLERPKFLAIIASNSLATMLARKASGRVDGFIIEKWTAGGHNAPPRGVLQLSDQGEPVYGERDFVDLGKMRELGHPFWLAGSAGSPEALVTAIAEGAAGIQVGTLFAFCRESGLEDSYRSSILASCLEDKTVVFTDPKASPTGYPFKVVHWAQEPVEAVKARKRVCDLGYLRTSYQRPDGKVGYRCQAEPIDAYVEKGGNIEDTTGRRCLCNALMADAGHAQVREGGVVEPPIVTSGDDLMHISRFLQGRSSYSASDVLDYLTSGIDASVVMASEAEPARA